MTDSNSFTRQGGKATPLRLVVKLVMIGVAGAAVVLLATSVAQTGDAAEEIPVSAARAGDTDPKPQQPAALPQARKSWDPVQYGPKDFEPKAGKIED